MNFLPSLTASGFAIAGLLCAAGPIIIHLMNRRRYRTVHWGAMDFLQQAMKRNRRILQLRDILLMILRTAAVLLFGLALARPFLSVGASDFDASQPLLAVLAIDNSMSMGVESLDGTLLDEAKRQAIDFLDQLPPGSRINVIAACGSTRSTAVDPYRTREDAAAAIAAIDPTDREADLIAVGNQIAVAAAHTPTLSPRAIFFTDQQASAWDDLRSAAQWEQFPPLQVVEIGADDSTNTSISGFELQDALADIDTPSTFVVRVSHTGENSRDDVPVVFSVNGEEVDSQMISLPPNSERELTFEYLFDGMAIEPGKATTVAVEVSLPPDRLPADDSRTIVASVVAALPVVFLDSMAEADEDPRRNRYGETWALRRLLAPVTSRREEQRQLIQVRHRRLEDLDAPSLRALLEDARLAVVGGIAEPPEFAVDVLNEFVSQGGQLVISAGGEFDPARWTQVAWRDGAGILPAPLEPIPNGVSLDANVDRLEPFRLSYDSMRDNAYFQLSGLSDSQLLDLYAEPLFFKSIVPRIDETTVAAVQKATKAEANKQVDEEDMTSDRWLLWRNDVTKTTAVSETAEKEAADSKEGESAEPKETPFDRRLLPRILARFDNDQPFLVERQMGDGKVLLVSTGIDNLWNTLPRTNAVLIFDRLLRGMLETTLPQRNFPTLTQVSLPLESASTTTMVQLARPGVDGAEELPIGFLDDQTRGVTVPQLLRGGKYELTVSERQLSSDPTLSPEPPQTMILAVQPQAAESQIERLTHEDFESRGLSEKIKWLSPGEVISLAGAQIRGQDWWKYLIGLALACLLIEMLLIARPNWVDRLFSRSESTGATPLNEEARS
ncbi:BatA domain-containing protein [Blastopirellula sp. JC732]|uniref:BatA domain-containing protein n=1 Tax=Blastopirellula sediminis TaxID=2894196 RepID=A0A9X1SI25_9BACT|nr:BatA domain-containing protein [Blastopirellula sediminis]MCC9609520.1 BatA domain-containing protein [Blastopirellula sediminis]MCC9627704.1 BatA domain-containing protein [Blastopirellula sediminis]